MKKIMAATVILLLAGIAQAAEEDHSQNPDRHASFALDFSNGFLGGPGVSTEYLYSRAGDTNIPFEDSLLGEMRLWEINPSVRLPMTNRLTVDLGMSYVHQDYDYAGQLTRFHGTLKGEIYHAGFRYYFFD